MVKLGEKNWPYVVGLAGAAALAYLWLAPRLIKPGIGYMPSFHIPGFPSGSMHPAHARAAMAPMMGKRISPMRNANIVGESGEYHPSRWRS